MSMQAQNKQIARDFLRALTTKDTKLLDSLFAEDIEYVVPGSSFLSRSYDKRTILGAMGYLYAMLDGSIHFDVVDLTSEEGRVSCFAKGKARTILGDDYNNTYHFLIYVKNGKVVKAYEFVDLLLVEQALKPAAQRACPELLAM
ncbi:MAG: nuclear transport factor 2 family protein [Steroidobacteraceae bacterium]